MNIIAVDDEVLALDTLVDSIAAAVPSAKVQGFRRGEQALEYVRAEGCDIAFLDIKMRGMNGLELAKRIKDIKGSANIVFVTGNSEYAIDAFRLYASDYLLKPATPDAVEKALENLRNPIKPQNDKEIRVQCFGNFEVYLNEKPIKFNRSKTKELLAFLIDRKGATVTMGEIVSVIWEDDIDTPSKRSNLRNLISELRKTFSKAGYGDAIIKNRNTLALNCEKISCDYYDFLQHVPYAVNSYQGEYMMQYSWAEITTASLTRFY